ncbi:MAG TPA: UDP-N-acetylmuramoyl-L-alanyl-D-glutamate--2,6-diaminopimelate ligase, partial [Clostridiales bacterium]|nr:UDP-N-acetylmuramoyl-L-alanyl-D-glutamate--2,6-diaminopimelate ligase [Clostridiales bacterium]
MDVCSLLRNVAVKQVLHYKKAEITKIDTDGRCVSEGSLFVCLTGGRLDGHDYVHQAEERGAVALLTEREVESGLPQFIVEDTRVALAKIAGNFYHNPAEELKIITVVGTNGKTSTADILCEIFTHAGYSAATIGTLGYKVDGLRKEGCLTTPDPVELHKNLADMLEKGVEYVILEASAHAIYYRKLAGIKAKATIFTNITQDHLDFFQNMENYAATKLSYFTHANTALAIVNSDDEYGRKLIASHTVPVITYGLNNPADVFAIDREEGENGLRFTLNAFDRIEEIRTALFGTFNVYNVMAATATAMYFGVPLPVIACALGKMKRVPGRYEVMMVKGRKVIVDYAHTPDGLENLLKDAKENKKRALITVFG